MSQHSLHRLHQVPSDEIQPEEGPPPTYETPSALDIDEACRRMTLADAAEANIHLTELHVIIKKILDDRKGLSREAQETLKNWKEEVFDSLETDRNPGFNYYYRENWQKIQKFFTELSQAQDRRGNPSPYEGRKLRVQEITRSISSLLVSGADVEGLSFINPWSTLMFKKITSSRESLEDPQKWRRILVIWRHIHDSARHQVAQEAPTHGRNEHYKQLRDRMELFLESHKVADVLAAMEINDAPSYSENEAPVSRWRKITRIGRRSTADSSPHGSSSQASLTHHRRLGIRQLDMRGLVPLGEAKDGGYYF